VFELFSAIWTCLKHVQHTAWNYQSAHLFCWHQRLLICSCNVVKLVSHLNKRVQVQIKVISSLLCKCFDFYTLCCILLCPFVKCYGAQHNKPNLLADHVGDFEIPWCPWRMLSCTSSPFLSLICWIFLCPALIRMRIVLPS